MKRVRPLFCILLLCTSPALAVHDTSPPVEGETAVAVRPAAPLRASVVFLSPTASDVVYGPTTLKVEIVPPTGTRVKGVEFIVDDKPVGHDGISPYEIVWDAGTSLDSHVLRAVASFSDGTTQEDAITTRKIIFVEHALVEGTALDHVELLVSVTDRSGAPVRGLKADAFGVRESGSTMKINSFKSVEGNGVPLSVAVLVDRSGSMQFEMIDWADACVALLSILRPTDQLRVAAFADTMGVVQDFTHDATSLQASLAAIGPAAGSTKLYRAIFETVRDMRDLPGRKVLVVLTDGKDTEIQGLRGQGSFRSDPMTQETVRMAVRSGVTIISILKPSPILWQTVEDIAVQTGGYRLNPSKDLRALMRRLGEGLLASYVVGYDSQRSGDVNRQRSVKVSVRRDAEESLEVRTALGVYASVDSLAFLKDDVSFGNAGQKARAIREIARLGSPDTASFIRKALANEDPSVRASALAALAEGGDASNLPEISKRVEDADPNVRQAAFDALVQFGPRAVPTLRDRARAGRSTRPAALRALGGTGDPNVTPDLAAAIEEGDCDAKAAAVEGIRSMAVLKGASWLPSHPPSDVPAAEVIRLLVETLGGSCGAADWAAVVLGRIAHPDAYPRLLGIVRTTPASPRLVEALGELPAYPTKESLEAIQDWLYAPPAVRQAARSAAALMYERSAITGEIIPSEIALGRLAFLGGEEALASFRRLMEQPAPAGQEKTWQRRIEATIKKLEESSFRPPASAP